MRALTSPGIEVAMNIRQGMWMRHEELGTVEVISLRYQSLQLGANDVAEVYPVGVHAHRYETTSVLIAELKPIEWDEAEMRSLAAHWISPSPSDRELTRFATGHDRNPGSDVDWKEFIAECELNQRMYATTYEDRHELATLIHYAGEVME